MWGPPLLLGLGGRFAVAGGELDVGGGGAGKRDNGVEISEIHGGGFVGVIAADEAKPRLDGGPDGVGWRASGLSCRSHCMTPAMLLSLTSLSMARYRNCWVASS